MADPRVEKLAKTLVEYSVKVKPKDWVIIFGNYDAEPLVSEVLKYVLRAGGYPNVLMGSERFAEIIFDEASDDQLKHITTIDRIPFENADVFVSINSAQNTRHLNAADPAKLKTRSAARKDVFASYMTRSASGALRWTLTNYPCHAYAQDADMSLTDYENFVYKATFADQPDPVKMWNDVEANQERLVKWLKGKKKMHLQSPDIDVTLSIDRRPFINSSATHNMPGSEIFTSPVEDSVNGWVKYTYPAIHIGREVEGIQLEFKDSHVVKATAEKNEDFLNTTLDTDAGARVVGELGIGTNFAIDRFTRSILYDEKIGGTIHMALGFSIPESGGKNESAIHWDMVCDMRTDSQITVDGDLFYKNGQFQV